MASPTVERTVQILDVVTTHRGRGFALAQSLLHQLAQRLT